ncbi:MAG TPA: GTPase Era [Fimbriimonas sp.]|nr:GTPase Era [Fimbriimonas sp.]
MSNAAFRAGLVALLGKPNVGKSTLMNAIVGQKVSIVSDKPQTTRRRVIGIATGSDYQIVFIDTPGIHEPHSTLAKGMVDQARSALNDVDLVVYVADGAHHPGELDAQIARLITGSVPSEKIILCLNKMDLLKPEDVERNVGAYSKLLGAEEYMLTTATKGHNVEKFRDLIVSKLPERQPLYDEDEFTDQSTRFFAAELVREKLLQATRQEVPHALAVLIDGWEEEENLTRIEATILVEKTSQRAIIIGKQGQFIKAIGTKARAEIEKLIGKQVFLQLHVRVEEGWRMNPRLLHELEYD